MSDFFTDNSALHQSWLEKLHSIAELSLCEHATCSFIRSTLETYAPSLQLNTPFPALPTAVLAIHSPSSPTSSPLLLRADIDALPITPCPSSPRLHPNVHHACGHDGHTAVLLSVAHYIHEHPPSRKVVLFFQPSEERGTVGRGSGAKIAVHECGLLRSLHTDAEEVYALHAWPGLPVGTYGVGKGVMMGESARIWVYFDGQGGHAAVEQKNGGDALLAACAFVNNSQTVVSRGIGPFEAAAMAWTQIEVVGSKGLNVLARNVKVGGTARGGAEGLIREIEEQLRRVANGIASSYGCTARVELSMGYGVTKNTVDGFENMKRAGEATGGKVVEVGMDVNGLKPSLCAEDFSVLLKERGGAYVWLGVGDEGRGGLHTSQFKFPASALRWGAKIFVELVEQQTIMPNGS